MTEDRKFAVNLINQVSNELTDAIAEMEKLKAEPDMTPELWDILQRTKERLANLPTLPLPNEDEAPTEP